MKDKLYILAKEFLLTFSNQKSLFSSKKIERAIAFVIVTLLIIFFVRHNFETMTAVDFTIVIAPLVTYMGFNSIMLSKDKKNDLPT